MRKISTALISTFDITDIFKFVKFLLDKNIVIYSTSDTYFQLQKVFNSNKIREVSSLTGYPEILNGTVKTFHPKIYGGILADKQNKFHKNELYKHSIPYIDLVIVNLYPFSDVINLNVINNSQQMLEIKEELAISNIDVESHALIRAASKNYNNVLTIVDPTDYDQIMKDWNMIDKNYRRKMAAKGFEHITKYDMMITEYFDPSKVCKIDDKYGR